MRVMRSVFVVLAALLLGLSLMVPANDYSETTYDESECLPFSPAPRVNAPQASNVRCGLSRWCVFTVREVFSARDRDGADASRHMSSRPVGAVPLRC